MCWEKYYIQSAITTVERETESCIDFQDPPSPGAVSNRSIPSTPSEFTFNSRSPAESLSELARNGPHHPLEEDVDPLDHPGNLTRTFPRDRDPRSSTTSHAQPLYRTFPLKELTGGGAIRGQPGGRGSQLLRPSPHPHPPIRPSDSELALQKLDSLEVSNKVCAPKNWVKGKLLGCGAFGQVFICHDSDTGMEMAVKVIDINHIDHRPHNMDARRMQTEVRSFETELQLLKNLRHERIVTYYGTDRADGKLYIFMECMPGGSVYQHLRDIGPLNEILARKYTRQILEGVAYLHDNRIVHRDVKGANILRDSFGNIKLADFGASKRLQTIRSGRSGLKSVQGTPYWMAPEVIKGEAYTDRADIWSVGATVVEMLQSHPPWYDFEPTAAMFKIVMEDTVPNLPAHCSEHATHFLTKCFIKDKSQRPSARELLETPFVNT
jgi:hypothetical protein